MIRFIQNERQHIQEAKRTRCNRTSTEEIFYFHLAKCTVAFNGYKDSFAHEFLSPIIIIKTVASTLWLNAQLKNVLSFLNG